MLKNGIDIEVDGGMSYCIHDGEGCTVASAKSVLGGAPLF